MSKHHAEMNHKTDIRDTKWFYPILIGLLALPLVWEYVLWCKHEGEINRESVAASEHLQSGEASSKFTPPAPNVSEKPQEPKPASKPQEKIAPSPVTLRDPKPPKKTGEDARDYPSRELLRGNVNNMNPNSWIR